MTLRSRTNATFSPPVMQAWRWIDGVRFDANRPLINVSQAAPALPPPLALREHIAQTAMNVPEAHLYGHVLGLPALRSEVARHWRQSYGGDITTEQVAITSGCNQAFAAAVSSLTTEGDEIIVPTPWYFNHKMWLDMQGVNMMALATGDGMLPDPKMAEALITQRTKAIVLITPNNPTGAEYPAGLVQAFFELAQRHGICLIVDETYRDFDSRDTAAHALFQRADWDDTLIQLYSFSKAYRLTGHRVGAVVASAQRLSEIEKFLDTVTICPNQLGQYAALWGMQNLSDWLAGERLEILARRAAISDAFAPLAAKGWKLLGLGAYFAYVEHPFDMASDVLAQKMVDEAQVLCLPGTMFMPEGDAQGKRQLRIAFANVDRAEIAVLFDRLETFTRKNLAQSVGD